MTCPAQVASGGLPAVNGTRLTFVYDGLSRRIEKRVETQAPGSSTWTMVDRVGFVYDGWNVVMSVRLNASGTVLGRIASYVWGPDVGSSWFARADWKRAGGVGGLLMILDGVSTPRSDGSNSPADPSDDDYFPLMDRLGNVTGYRKAANNTAYNDLSLHGAVYEYDAFGRELRSSGPVADWAPFHFSTKFTDAETGLNYYGYRYYDAAKGRWLSRDPIGERAGENIYVIVQNDAINAVDQLGLVIVHPAVVRDGHWLSKDHPDISIAKPFVAGKCGVFTMDLKLTSKLGGKTLVQLGVATVTKCLASGECQTVILDVAEGWNVSDAAREKKDTHAIRSTCVQGPFCSGTSRVDYVMWESGEAAPSGTAPPKSPGATADWVWPDEVTNDGTKKTTGPSQLGLAYSWSYQVSWDCCHGDKNTKLDFITNFDSLK